VGECLGGGGGGVGHQVGDNSFRLRCFRSGGKHEALKKVRMIRSWGGGALRLRGGGGTSGVRQ
jgi:hypothetical protein